MAKIEEFGTSVRLVSSGADNYISVNATFFKEKA